MEISISESQPDQETVLLRSRPLQENSSLHFFIKLNELFQNANIHCHITEGTILMT